MADMITAKQLREFKSKYKNPVVVAYVNTSAEVKAESDICCTSSNALNVVKSLSGDETIIFVPDRNLGAYVQKNSGKEMIIWNGFCPTHNNLMLPEHLIEAKRAHPEAEVLVHPECRPEVVALADHAMSTGVMCRYVPTSAAKEFIIGTETGILYKLAKENPGKKFYPVNDLAVCPNMKKITLDKVLDALANDKNIVTVPEDTAEKARLPIERMLKIS